MATLLLELEGAGTEIAERLSDYADRKIRVIVLPVTEMEARQKDERPVAERLAEAAPSPDEQNAWAELTLAERFAGRVGRLSFEPVDLSERTEEYYGELLRKNYAP